MQAQNRLHRTSVQFSVGQIAEARKALALRLPRRSQWVRQTRQHQLVHTRPHSASTTRPIRRTLRHGPVRQLVRQMTRAQDWAWADFTQWPKPTLVLCFHSVLQPQASTMCTD